MFKFSCNSSRLEEYNISKELIRAAVNEMLSIHLDSQVNYKVIFIYFGHLL